MKTYFKKHALKVFLFVAIPAFSIFISLFLYFKITAPEGCAVLQHYFLGNGEPLTLESDYLPKSPIIINALKGMRVGEVKKISFSQKEDWRLSYALNPFQLKKVKNGFDVYEYIKFDNKGKVYTTINLGVLKFKFADNWVHFLKTTPYHLSYQYREK